MQPLPEVARQGTLGDHGRAGLPRSHPIAHPKVQDSEVLAALSGVFRQFGFEGASLSRIVEATGLQRASLYHRFGGGKEEMAARVVEEVHREFRETILAPLGAKGEARARLKRAAARLSEFYGGGERSCILDLLSLGEPSGEIVAALRAAYDDVTGALATVAREAGASPAEARRRAEEVMIQIQGALVLSRVRGDTQAFRRVIRGLPDRILGT